MIMNQDPEQRHDKQHPTLGQNHFSHSLFPNMHNQYTIFAFFFTESYTSFAFLEGEQGKGPHGWLRQTRSSSLFVSMLSIPDISPRQSPFAFASFASMKWVPCAFDGVLQLFLDLHVNLAWCQQESWVYWVHDD